MKNENEKWESNMKRKKEQNVKNSEKNKRKPHL